MRITAKQLSKNKNAHKRKIELQLDSINSRNLIISATGFFIFHSGLTTAKLNFVYFCVRTQIALGLFQSVIIMFWVTVLYQKYTALGFKEK